MGLLEVVLQKTKWVVIPFLSSLTLSCGSCNDEKLTVAECDPRSMEICNNYIDDNCNGRLNEGCDEDDDGYCTANKPIEYLSNKLPEICLRTFEKCFPNEDCASTRFEYDCDDNNPEINPGMPEMCDGLDNNCDANIDELFPELGSKCGPELGANLELDGIGLCYAGNVGCNKGQLVCTNYLGPAENELCNNVSDTCGKEPETVLTEARICYWTWKTDGYGNKVKFELPLNHSTIGVGICNAGVELCIDGIVGGDQECHGSQLPELEICDCTDNDCDNEIDDGLHTANKLEYAAAVDTSGSMNDKIELIRQRYSGVNTPACFSDQNIRVSTIRIGEHSTTVYEPVLKRSRASVREFSINFNVDIPNTVGPHLEPSANTVVYTACAVLEDQRELLSENEQEQLPEICQRIYDYNSLRKNHPHNYLQQPVFNPEAVKTLIILSDERYQWISGLIEIPPLINQQEAAQLAQQAGIKVIVFTEPVFNNHERSGLDQGYAYFEDSGGKVLDLNSVDAGEYLEQLIKDDYCSR